MSIRLVVCCVLAASKNNFNRKCGPVRNDSLNIQSICAEWKTNNHKLTNKSSMGMPTKKEKTLWVWQYGRLFCTICLLAFRFLEKHWSFFFLSEIRTIDAPEAGGTSHNQMCRNDVCTDICLLATLWSHKVEQKSIQCSFNRVKLVTSTRPRKVGQSTFNRVKLVTSTQSRKVEQEIIQRPFKKTICLRLR